MVKKKVTTSTQDLLEFLESLSDDFRQMQASTSHLLPVFWLISSGQALPVSSLSLRAQACPQEHAPVVSRVRCIHV